MALGLLLPSIPAASAIDLEAPTPPPAVLAAWSDEGVVVAWLPPAYDGGSPVTGYNVYRLDQAALPMPAWDLVGNVAGNLTSFIDSTVPDGLQAIYSVAALNSNGQSPTSPPSPPIMGSTSGGGNGGGDGDGAPFYSILLLYLGHGYCAPLGVDVYTHEPYVAWAIYQECLPV